MMRRSRGLAMLGVLMWAVGFGCGAPRIGPDREAFRAVDALFTAVSIKDAGQLARCAATLEALEGSGKLPSAAAGRLSAIVAEAKGGAWESARDRLREFMDDQHP